jgi:prolipoprotein diacylglyceryltransferase
MPQIYDLPNRSETHIQKLQTKQQNFFITISVVMVLFGCLILSMAAGVVSRDFTAFNNVSNLLVGGLISIFGGIVGALFTINMSKKDVKVDPISEIK